MRTQHILLASLALLGGAEAIDSRLPAPESQSLARSSAAPASTSAAADAGSRLHLLPGFVETRRVASPYATQAAAADGRHLYAISNTTIASHDRQTGRLTATATATDAKHLNSGFFHEGRLYCAHSNYPATPHESDIRVFDPAAGSLKLHHRFPDPPGSLVWCVRHGGNWWCCFAWYGPDNARSVLVEYAEGELEVERQRFHFPAEVVADFDGMSASGGIWRDGSLLASHHHFPVLYRLALPEAAAANAAAQPSALVLVAAVACPFPGQGFAADPVTGGLVGIDRQTREIVLARPPDRR